jgi:hypothetical protein
MIPRYLKRILNDPDLGHEKRPQVELPKEKDKIDFSPRGEAVRRVERMKYYVARGGHKGKGTVQEDYAFAQEISKVFGYLDKHFIGSHAETNPELVEDGYYLLDRLMFLSWYAGCRHDQAAINIRARANGSLGGEVSGSSRKANQAEKWGHEALSHADDYLKRHKKYTQAGLARYILDKLGGRGPKTDRQIKTAISEWLERGIIRKSVNKP